MDIRSHGARTKVGVAVLSVVIKLLLFAARFSTDFEVHRNWMAITSSLPTSQWYVDETSPWTLDYPPLFAYFELCLGTLAKNFDAEMTQVSPLAYESTLTILYQRSSVLVAGDAVLLFAAWIYDANAHEIALLILHPALLIVDNVHFQYNGFVIGVLLLAFSCLADRERGKFCLGAALFAAAVNLKQTLLYCVPVTMLFVLASNRIRDICQAAVVAAFMFLLIWLPFIPQLTAVLARLFPFGRGLLHAYWAPNLWSIAAALDIVLSAWRNRKSKLTRGLTGVSEPFTVLPNVTPRASLILTVISMSPAFLYLLKSRALQRRNLLTAAAYAFLCAFMFGWHVHEKALLLSILPFALVQDREKSTATIFRLMSISGTFALYPLLTDSAIISTKYVLLLTFTVFIATDVKLPALETLYYCGIPLAEFYSVCLHFKLFKDQLQFLPLAVISCYSAVGIFVSWILFTRYLLREALDPHRVSSPRNISAKFGKTE
mmetsp:Transcript_514/g.1761  ORF Transcript_514/g.1761 Transcript_514/m.1761 type:complete len:489 (-) Transcript_514:2235-3701(-)|eukprot:CAMPEP_0198726666 /NCGR_PEP_ID=MMETSP1475-20131203/3648_1 /TAXON_ID= ORGANISM="Unidentified sp., Strain CCMP1999" /NCGR_SAMPLE_ID=MMETSP1475 /ASSEMBLY_ACC=CAM_ASM_001111 /LENGTH=488 /DNA_ID=CAMNT_0044488615 /DNA_START=179 /DNA_END=1645 /DNA_ORIENTATION=+